METPLNSKSINQSNQLYDYNTQETYVGDNPVSDELCDDGSQIEQRMSDLYIDENNQQKDVFKGNNDFEPNYEHTSISPTSNSGHR